MSRSHILSKPSAFASVAILLAATAAPLFTAPKAAAALLTTRSIQMESSASGSVADGQGVIYKVNFTTGTTGNIGSAAVEFCSNSPIIGDSCTAPTGLDVNEGSLTIPAGQQTGITDWSTSPQVNTTTNRVVLTRTAASVTASTAVSFELGTGASLNGITNPTNTNTTFYARIYTYATTDGTGAATDSGGIALSTTAQITVTAKVQERLFFCVYTTGAGNDCTTKSGTAVTLGDTNGVLSPTGPFVDKTAKFSITTNASGNAVVTMKGTTLTSGANTITAVGGTAATSTTGSEQFGVCAYQSAGTGVTLDNLYDGDTAGTTSTACTGTSQTAGTGATGGDNSAGFAFDTAATTSTYGDVLATKPAGDWSTVTIPMVGNISNLTEAGIYTTTLTFIATGTY